MRGLPFFIMQLLNNSISDSRSLIRKLLVNHSNYYAHLKGIDTYETLLDHSLLTLDYFSGAVSSSGLNEVFENLISKVINNSGIYNQEKAEMLITEMIVNVIAFHDIGKINSNFQREKLNNPYFTTPFQNNIGSQHSILSAFIYLCYTFNSVKKYFNKTQDQNKLLLLSLVFVHPVIKHHGAISNGGELKITPDIITGCNEYLDLLSLDENTQSEFINFLGMSENFLSKLNYLKSDIHLFLLIKLVSSLLTSSDYKATNEFMLGIKSSHSPELTEELKEKFISGVSRIPYNAELYQNLDYYYSLEPRTMELTSAENLNNLRQSLSANLVQEIRKNPSKSLYYIEAPTGAGKTNLSLLALIELLKQNRHFTKVFYVFPFTTLITQTLLTLVKSLDLTPSEITEIHSKASFTAAGMEDDVYGSQRKNFLDALFLNYPVALLSHIKFFNILVSNRKDSNYLLSVLPNSLVIIDEIQSYNPNEWDKVNYLINMFSRLFNITFILMSATLPKISRLLIPGLPDNNDNFTYLIKNSNTFYSNPNFGNRVNTNFDYLETLFSFEWLAETIYSHSETRFKKYGSVRAVVEFVKKKRASDFLSFVSSESRFSDYTLYIISGTILEPRRRQIVDNLKKTSLPGEKILVITTQVIEAGVDIDMDIGFKDRSLIDSEEQFAGRINRNAIKKESSLFIFNTGDAAKIYGSDIRYKTVMQNPGLYKETLINKTFDTFYAEIFNLINRNNENELMAENLQEFIDYISGLDFRQVKEMFKLIESESLSVFVPLSVSAEFFTTAEVDFMSRVGIRNSDESSINGEAVWEYFEKLVSCRNLEFIDRAAELKIIQSLMSKFTFSTFYNQFTIKPILNYGEIKYGFLYFRDYQEIYSFETGLTSNFDTGSNFI